MTALSQMCDENFIGKTFEYACSGFVADEIYRISFSRRKAHEPRDICESDKVMKNVFSVVERKLCQELL